MEYSPLFEPGLHEMQETELDNHFLLQFQSSTTRPKLIAGLKVFLASLKSIGIYFEIWLDGSFSTTKENPNDIDMVVFANSNELNKLTLEKQNVVRVLFDRENSKRAFGCDVLFAPNEDFNLRSYWRGWYGFDRNENPKGIIKIAVHP